jgi:hypothetical protein
MESKTDFLSLSDALVILLRRKGIFALVFLLVLSAALAHALLARKTWELTGTYQVGKFKGELLEEGEFVAQKFKDYSFLANALAQAGISLDISLTRMQKYIKTEVVNEVKKTKDVGLVQLNVRYKDREKVHAIFKALTERMMADHAVLLARSIEVLKDEEQGYRDLSQTLAESIATDEDLSRKNARETGEKTAPSLLLLEHTISEKRSLRSLLNKNLHEVRLDAEAATTSFPSCLAAPPALPDSPFKPKLPLNLLIGFTLGLILAASAAFFSELWCEEVQPKMRARSSNS